MFWLQTRSRSEKYASSRQTWVDLWGSKMPRRIQAIRRTRYVDIHRAMPLLAVYIQPWFGLSERIPGYRCCSFQQGPPLPAVATMILFSRVGVTAEGQWVPVVPAENRRRPSVSVRGLPRQTADYRGNCKIAAGSCSCAVTLVPWVPVSVRGDSRGKS